MTDIYISQIDPSQHIYLGCCECFMGPLYLYSTQSLANHRVDVSPMHLSSDTKDLTAKQTLLQRHTPHLLELYHCEEVAKGSV